MIRSNSSSHLPWASARTPHDWSIVKRAASQSGSDGPSTARSEQVGPGRTHPPLNPARFRVHRIHQPRCPHAPCGPPSPQPTSPLACVSPRDPLPDPPSQSPASSARRGNVRLTGQALYTTTRPSTTPSRRPAFPAIGPALSIPGPSWAYGSLTISSNWCGSLLAGA
jgi:hypothetical protein